MNNPFEEILARLDRIETRLSSPKVEVVQVEEPDIIGVEEAMRITGRSYSWITSKTMSTSPDPIPHFRFGKDLRFSRKALREYMSERTIPKVGVFESVNKHLSEVASQR